MTDLRKICPNSGARCDCSKGVCRQHKHEWQVIDDEWEECKTCFKRAKHEAAAIQIHEREVREELILRENEAVQADSLEAHSLKYQACAQIMQLSSGRFALFGAYRAGGGSGIALIAIGEWGELEQHVREYKQLADAAWARGQERTLPAKTTADYDSLFGEET